MYLERVLLSRNDNRRHDAFTPPGRVPGRTPPAIDRKTNHECNEDGNLRCSGASTLQFPSWTDAAANWCFFPEQLFTDENMNTKRRNIIAGLPLALMSKKDPNQSSSPASGEVDESVILTKSGPGKVAWGMLANGKNSLAGKSIIVEGFFIACSGLDEGKGYYVFDSAESLLWRRTKSFVDIHTKDFEDTLGDTMQYLDAISPCFVKISGQWKVSDDQEYLRALGTLVGPLTIEFIGNNLVNGIVFPSK